MGEVPVEERDERSDEGEKADVDVEAVVSVVCCPACAAVLATAAVADVERGAAVALRRGRFAGGEVVRGCAFKKASASPSCRLAAIARVSRRRACCRGARR